MDFEETTYLEYISKLITETEFLCKLINNLTDRSIIFVYIFNYTLNTKKKLYKNYNHICDCEATAYIRFRHLGHYLMVLGYYQVKYYTSFKM
jgi:hypothetical protein